MALICISREFLAAAKIPTIEAKYLPGENVYLNGAPAQFFYEVDQGALFRFRLLPGDRRSINQFLLPGDSFGYEIGRHHRDTVQALTRTTVLAVGREALVAASSCDIQLANLLFNAAVMATVVADEQSDVLRVKTATERIAQFLLEMEARLSARGKIDLPMRRREIADYLGLALETVSRVLNALRREKIIRFVDREQRQLVICNKQRLHRIVSNASTFDHLTGLRRQKDWHWLHSQNEAPNKHTEPQAVR
jgi:CRP/FNR family transcriptional regulator, nitrogen fixation regulation protein